MDKYNKTLEEQKLKGERITKRTNQIIRIQKKYQNLELEMKYFTIKLNNQYNISTLIECLMNYSNMGDFFISAEILAKILLVSEAKV